MSRVWIVFLLLMAVIAGLGVAWIYANMIYKPPPYSSIKNIPPKNETTNISNDSTNSNNQSRDLDKVVIIPQASSESDYGKLINTSIKNLRIKTFDISGNNANLTFSYLTSEGKPGTLSLNVKYGFSLQGGGLYYLGSDPFPFKIGDKIVIQLAHVEKKGDTSNARIIQGLENNERITPEERKALKVALDSFGDTVLTRQDLEKRLEQWGDIRFEDDEVQVNYINSIN